tara:strand:- start:1076 stop:1738 length:663 start_codon:yes stop_codon:yes gene_type:complete
MNDLNQLLLNFNHKQNFHDQDFFVSKSNFYAYEIIDNWPKWEKNILNIHGEKYSGKTHLANIFINKHKGKKINSKSFTDDDIKKLKIHENIILDSYNNNIDERLLYALFNLVDQSNKYLIINSLKPINEMTFKLNDIKSRSKNCLFAKIDNPDDELIFALILKSFSDRQIKIDKKIIDFITKRIDRSYSKISEFIYKIDELSLKKKKPINIKTVNEILKE